MRSTRGWCSAAQRPICGLLVFVAKWPKGVINREGVKNLCYIILQYASLALYPLNYLSIQMFFI